MINPADINAAIAARETEVDRMRRDLEIMEAKLRGMKELRDEILGTPTPLSATSNALKPDIGHFNVSGSKASYRAGRQPGAISKEWRLILADLYLEQTIFADGDFDEASVISAARKHGINLKHSDAKLRMAAYKEHGYIEGADGHWNVTDFAARKFGFLEKKPEQKEAPTAQAEEPHEIRHPADQTGAG